MLDRISLLLPGSALALTGIKTKWPTWRQCNSLIRFLSRKYTNFTKSTLGDLSNPPGARALYHSTNVRDTVDRIHGTNQPTAIGKTVSNNCMRRLNEQVKNIFKRVPVGAQVVAI